MEAALTSDIIPVSVLPGLNINLGDVFPKGNVL
jgi:hypothetical protein